MEINATSAIALPQVPPNISEAAAANGLADSASRSSGRIPKIAIVATT